MVENLREECPARGLELPTFWLPRQTVKVKFTLIKSFRFKEWCAQGDDFRTFLKEFVSSVPQVELPTGRLAGLVG